MWDDQTVGDRFWRGLKRRAREPYWWLFIACGVAAYLSAGHWQWFLSMGLAVGTLLVDWHTWEASRAAQRYARERARSRPPGRE